MHDQAYGRGRCVGEKMRYHWLSEKIVRGEMHSVYLGLSLR